MPSSGQLRAGRSGPMTWALGFVLVALTCLVSARPMLAHAGSAPLSDRIFRLSPSERTLSSAFLPGSMTSTEARRIEKHPEKETPLASVPDLAPETIRVRVAPSDRCEMPAPVGVRTTRARGPPRVSLRS